MKDEERQAFADLGLVALWPVAAGCACLALGPRYWGWPMIVAPLVVVVLGVVRVLSRYQDDVAVRDYYEAVRAERERES